MTRNKKVVYLEKEQLLKKSCPKCVHQTTGLSTKADGRTELRGDLIAGHCSPPLSDRTPQTARAWSPVTHRSAVLKRHTQTLQPQQQNTPLFNFTKVSHQNGAYLSQKSP